MTKKNQVFPVRNVNVVVEIMEHTLSLVAKPQGFDEYSDSLRMDAEQLKYFGISSL